jgi:5-phospho-D-xylono-1,4-lactonase
VSNSTSPDQVRQKPVITTVSGPVEIETVAVADAHCHLWIDPDGVDSPALTDEPTARSELSDFAAAGGNLVLDCQPVLAGRDARVLSRLAVGGRVSVVASTGFHLQRYYRDAAGPWSMGDDAAHDLFVRELETGMEEAPDIRAGCVKAAWTGDGGGEESLMRAAVAAAVECGSALTVHTESGRKVETLVALLQDCGAEPGRVQISHMDKRPDGGLHAELAVAGYVLGYDTFLRPKYDPERGVWPLLSSMIASGHWSNVAIGLDLIEAPNWHVSGGPGLRTIPCAIALRLRVEGGDDVAAAMTGSNIARVLAQDPERRGRWKTTRTSEAAQPPQPATRNR